MAGAYYMLVASLPHLPHYLRAERLPINPQRLRLRRSCLNAEDAVDLAYAVGLLHWPRHPLARTDDQIDALYRRAMQKIRCPSLVRFVDEVMGQRSVVAALCRKVQRPTTPAADQRCGVGRWDSLIRQRWDREGFGLGALFPWVGQAQAMIAQGQAAELEALLMECDWRRASRLADEDAFGFQAVFAYVFKWELLARRLAHNASEAARQFSQMVDEVIHDKQPNPQS